MSETGSDSEVNSEAAAESEDTLAKAAAAGPPLTWADGDGDASDDHPEDGEQPDLIFQVFREPEEFRHERGD